MKAIISALIIVQTILGCQGQSESSRSGAHKVDSVFSYYFVLFNLEVNHEPIQSKNRHLYTSFLLESDSAYLLRDLPTAMRHMKELSGIEIPYAKMPSDRILTREIVEKWDVWYQANRNRIGWSTEKNEPILLN